MRAVAYARVSTDNEDQINSLNAQIEYFNEKFMDNKYEKSGVGFLYRKDGTRELLEGTYADEGLSGTSLKKREAFKQMINDAKQGKFDTIFVKSVSRFGRSVEDVSKTYKDLKEYNVGVYFLDLQINSLDHSKEFMINLFASLAQEESNNKSYITQFGIRKAQKSGKWTGGTPYGYNIVKGYLEVNEKEAEVVQKIFHLYHNEGYGTGKLARHLNQKGIETKQNTFWSQKVLTTILSNPLYTGLQIQHREQTIDINRGLVKQVPEVNWISQYKDKLRIIDDETFKLVQLEKERRREELGKVLITKQTTLNNEGDQITTVNRTIVNRGSTRHSNQHLFSNLIKCGHCGGTHRRKLRDTKTPSLGYQWICGINSQYGKVRCPYMNGFGEDKLIELVLERIEERKNEESHDQVYIEYLNKKMSIDSSDEKIKELYEKENELLLEREANFKLYSKSLISDEEYMTRNERISSEINKVKSELQKIQNIEKELELVKLKYTQFLKTLESVNSENLSNTNLKKIIDKIIIYTIEDKDHPTRTRYMSKEVIIDWKFIDVSESSLYDPTV